MSFKRTLSLTLLMALLILIPGCATARPPLVVVSCVSDPDTQVLKCVDPAGLDFEIPWKLSANYVCRPPSEDQALMDEAHAK